LIEVKPPTTIETIIGTKIKFFLNNSAMFI
jgi:hypothetical protein